MNTQVHPHRGNESARVAILLCTYNGARFLEAQLESFERQTHANWVVYASDDGSSDATLEILQRYRQRLGEARLVILPGPCQGFARNFLSLIKNGSIVADYFAFSDQDDVWFPDKLQRGLERLHSVPASQPALACSRTRLVDADGRVLGFSPLFRRAPCFRNALVQSLAGANTMLLNAAARDLLVYTPDEAHVVSHDWLAYLLVSGCGGVIAYDPQPTLDYRQHGANLIGENSSLLGRLVRIRRMFGGTFSEWNRHNLEILADYRGRLLAENGAILDRFDSARHAGLLRRLYLLKRSGVYRQSLADNIGLFVAASIRRV